MGDSNLPAYPDAALGERVVAAVAEATNIRAEDFLSYRRKEHLVRARRILCTALRSLDFSTPEIGAVVDRDHSSVLHSLRTADDDEIEIATRVVDAVRGVPHLMLVRCGEGYAVKHPRSGELTPLPRPLTEGLKRWLEIL